MTRIRSKWTHVDWLSHSVSSGPWKKLQLSQQITTNLYNIFVAISNGWFLSSQKIHQSARRGQRCEAVGQCRVRHAVLRRNTQKKCGGWETKLRCFWTLSEQKLFQHEESFTLGTGKSDAEKQIHFEFSAGIHVKTAMACHHAWHKKLEVESANVADPPR